MTYEFVEITQPAINKTTLTTTYGGATLDDYLTDGNGSFQTLTISGRSNLSNQTPTFDVAGQDGLSVGGRTNFLHREIIVKYKITDKTKEGFIQRINSLNDLLSVEEKELIFNDEPFYFKAILQSNELPEEEGLEMLGTLTFFCSKPFKHGDTKSADRRLTEVFVNEGTADTYPVLTFDLGMTTSSINVANANNLTERGTMKRITIGHAQSPQQEEVNPLELVFHDTMSSTQSWQTATEIDNGHIDGEMDANNEGFYAKLFGSPIDYTRWQGPSLIKAIGQPLQDFQADIFVKNLNVGKNGTGMIEIYFRDANGNRVAKIGVEDLYTNSEEIQGKARFGSGSNYYDIYTKPDEPTGWNNFDGILRIRREGNVFRPYFAQIRAGGRHSWVRGQLKYIDTNNTASAPITHVQAAIRKFPSPDETDMAIKEIKLYKVNKVTDTETQVPMSFEKGDQVVIDCGKGLVTLNGEQRNDLIMLDTEFFSLVPGINRLQSNMPFIAEWRERFL